ncbi:hypothetical protein BKA82DRAFT_35471 [Pisolithus tinctorius]|uniref:Uncharacterized protein n=1 Tax=Pisolithus tinctorius Marx 270 TaxID=870435 RepID=A0A0C3NE13_PISTI|nr:hypothetical protein BKA82DRAFT_35471 [Pisolithus tinctorius]KIN94030.1 hypothetical protein M404DRAFT_35471 [Pisolithus tinctorius Marx 270]
MSTTNTSTFIPEQSTDNIQPVITTENAKQMVEEAARLTMQALRGLRGQDGTHWRKVAQLVWAQLGMVHTVVEHLPPAFKIPPHLIAIDMHMVDLAIIFADVKDHPWYRLRHQPKSHPYYKVMEKLTRPSLRAEHQAQPVDKGKGKELGSEHAPTDTTAKTTGIVIQKPGNEEDQNKEKAWGHSQSRCGQPVAKPVDASDQTSRGQSQFRRPTKKAKPAVNEDVQDRRDINNPPKSWEVVPEAERGGETSLRCSEKPPDQGLAGNDPQKIPPAFPPLQCLLCQLHRLVDKPNVKGHQAKINLPVHPK